MKKFIEFIGCILMTMFLSSCPECGYTPDYDGHFFVINNSSQPVVCYLALGIPALAPTAYPDTMLPAFCHIPDKEAEFNRGAVLSETPLLVLLGPTNSASLYEFAYRDVESVGPGVDTVSAFFINADTLITKGYNYVRDHYRILVRYDVSMDEFRNDPQIFHFPPSEDMKDVKMYPSYEEFTKVYNPHNL